MCDLLWSLAFNNGLVKEVVGRQGGIALILKGMSSHLSSPELVKSACGALSNMCQNTYNQNLIAAHGGVRYEWIGGVPVFAHPQMMQQSGCAHPGHVSVTYSGRTSTFVYSVTEIPRFHQRGNVVKNGIRDTN